MNCSCCSVNVIAMPTGQKNSQKMQYATHDGVNMMNASENLMQQIPICEVAMKTNGKQ